MGEVVIKQKKNILNESSWRITVIGDNGKAREDTVYDMVILSETVERMISEVTHE